MGTNNSPSTSLAHHYQEDTLGSDRFEQPPRSRGIVRFGAF